MKGDKGECRVESGNDLRGALTAGQNSPGLFSGLTTTSVSIFFRNGKYHQFKC